MATIPDEARDLFGPPHHAVVATISPSGAAQLSTVWITHDEGQPSFNTVDGRVKVRNLRRDPRCTLLVYDLTDPERYVQVRGTAQVTVDVDLAHCLRLDELYTGSPDRDIPPDHQRVIVEVQPERVLYRPGP